VVTTCDGKAIIDESHPLWSGIIGGYGCDCANKASLASDLIIFLGTQTSDQTTSDWNNPKPGTRIIQIDIDASEIGRNYFNTFPLPGDARTVIEQLTPALAAGSRDSWLKEVADYTKATFDKQAARWASNDAPIDPARLCKEISAVLPDDAVIVSDTGWSAIWTSNYLRMKASQIYIRAAGTLGWSFPASLGAKCGVPNRPVINFTGDGGFFYYLGEMETAVRYNIPTVTVVNNNHSLGQIVAPAIGLAYQDDPEQCKKRYGFTQVNLANVAREFGLFAERVESPDKIGPAIKAALQSGKPSLVEVVSGMQEPAAPLEK
jgi:acetolactate synthase-1/2/3 large subunit